MNDSRISTPQAGRIIGLTDEAIRNHIQAGRLSAVRVGMKGWYRIQLADLKALAAQYNYPVDEAFVRNLEK